ncbi:MAG: signal peptidase I [Acidimicrobiales bacterium]
MSPGRGDRAEGQGPGPAVGAGVGGRGLPLPLEILVLLVTAVVIAVLLRAFVAQAFFIPSASMVPQLEVGDRVVVSKLAYDLHDPRRGDVVVFDCPTRAGCIGDLEEGGDSLVEGAARGVLEAVGLRQPSTEEFVKRVIALAGETVEGRGGDIFIDGKRLVEPYLPPGSQTAPFDPVEVPAEEVWVMGDNRQNSSDSRVFGPIPWDTVVGRAVVRVWPPLRAAFL